MDDGLTTVDALAFAGLRRETWNDVIARGLYPRAPKVTAPAARVFNIDALIAVYILGRLYECEVVPRVATKIATDIHRLIERDHSIQALSAWRTNATIIVAEDRPFIGAIELFRWEIAELRVRALDEIRTQLRNVKRSSPASTSRGQTGSEVGLDGSGRADVKGRSTARNSNRRARQRRQKEHK